MNFRRRFLLRHSRGVLGGLALVALCCTVYLPGFFTIPPVDRDESRFAQASRQMFESVALPEGERDPVLHSGGLAVPMLAGEARLNKPPLISWVQAASAAVFTGGRPLEDAIWMYRVPSLLAGIVIVLATWRIGCSMFDPRAGWLAGALLAVAPVFVWEAHQARADMVMVAFTTLAMGQLWKIWRHASGPSRAPRPIEIERAGERVRSVAPSLLLWTFTALGILTKGPITPMIVVLTALTLGLLVRKGTGGRAFQPATTTTGGRAFQPATTTGGRAFQPATTPARWLRAAHPLLGLVILTLAITPWVYAVARQVGFSHYWSIVYDEVIVRAGSAREGHWGPPGYHIVLLVALFWPGSLLTGLAIGRAWRRGLVSRARRGEESRGSSPLPSPPPRGAGEGAGKSPSSLRSRSAGIASSLLTIRSLRTTRRPEAFLIAWFLPSWIVFELVGTKLPHYTMPLYPAVALITARGVFAAASHRLPGVERRTSRVGFGAWCIPALLIALGLGACLYSSLGGHWNDRPPVLLLAALQVVAIVAAGVAMLSIRRRRWLGALAGGAVLMICLSVGVLGAYLPRMDRVWFTTTLVEHATAAEVLPLAASGFHEDSLVYLTRGRIDLIEKAEQGVWWGDHPDGLMILPEGDVLRSHSVVARVSGFRYTKGREEQLAIVRWWHPVGSEP